MKLFSKVRHSFHGNLLYEIPQSIHNINDYKRTITAMLKQ